jgi:predicted metal-dependent enzyme (double-stranded beta helix superfamily)
MAYSLDQLATDIRETLKSTPMPAGGEAVCKQVQRALTDEAFRAENFASDKTAKRTIIHEDPELGFCICVHIYEGAAHSGPHDHGTSWAIYGQAEGETEMTDWRIVSPVSDDKPAKVVPERVYTLKPGMAHFYPVGAVHSPTREDSTKLLRIEGANLDNVKRTPIVRAESENA